MSVGTEPGMDSGQIYRTIRDAFAELFPLFADRAAPLPMKINVHLDLLADPRAMAVADEGQIRMFLKFWATRREYKLALAVEADRFDLQGERCGVVEEYGKRVGEAALLRFIGKNQDQIGSKLLEAMSVTRATELRELCQEIMANAKPPLTLSTLDSKSISRCVRRRSEERRNALLEAPAL